MILIIYLQFIILTRDLSDNDIHELETDSFTNYTQVKKATQTNKQTKNKQTIKQKTNKLHPGKKETNPIIWGYSAVLNLERFEQREKNKNTNYTQVKETNPTNKNRNKDVKGPHGATSI